MVLSLPKDSIIDLIAPSYPPKALEDLHNAARKLKEAGFQPRYPETIVDPTYYIYANSDEKRLECLKQAILAEDSRAIWAIRGGAGASDLLTGLKGITPPFPKTLIGYSDITALHLFMSQQWGWQTIHGAVLIDNIREDRAPENYDTIIDILQGKPALQITDLQQLNQSPWNAIEGAATGGNAALIQAGFGTFWSVDTTNKIVIIEDVDEYSYAVKRRFTHFMQAGFFDKCKAVIFGQFLPHPQDQYSHLLDGVLSEFANKISAPVFRSNLIGHARQNLPWIVEGNATIAIQGHQIVFEQKLR
jgi:muramoyltetrapeptide carboxypeptidase